MRFLGRRLAFYAVTAWAAITINFLIPRLMPGNPLSILIARFRGRVDAQEIHALQVAFGLSTASTWSQYLSYLGNLAHGNLGLSITYFPASVTSVIAQRLPWTLALVGVATIISFVVGTALGAVAAWRRGSWLETLLPLATFGSAIPYFWLALVLLFVFAGTLGWLPLTGAYGLTEQPGFNGAFINSALIHGLLPAVTIVVSSIGGSIVGMRNMMVTVLGEDYVVMAEAKGLAPRRVLWAYAARNAILPSVSNFALSLGFIVAGSLLTEMIFSYPGVGYAMLQAVQNDDFPLMQGIFLVISLTVLAANFLADLVYVVLDPRTRQEATS